MRSGSTREREWDNIVTCHEGECKAYTWFYLAPISMWENPLTPFRNYQKKALGQHALDLRGETASPVKVQPMSRFAHGQVKIERAHMHLYVYL
jgi:hypothetical protein